MTVYKNFWTVDTLAAHLKIHENTLRGYIRNGKMIAVLSGTRYLIPQQEVDRYIASQTGRLSKAGRATK